MGYPLSTDDLSEILVTIMAPIIDCLKQGKSKWTKAAVKAFREIKGEDDRSSCYEAFRFFF